MRLMNQNNNRIIDQNHNSVYNSRLRGSTTKNIYILYKLTFYKNKNNNNKIKQQQQEYGIRE